MARRYVATSHESISHDHLEDFGYDWSRVADPAIKPKYPLRIYFPQSLEEVVQIVLEANHLREKLVVRSKGHSSNDLVLADRGSVLSTVKLDRIIDVNEHELTATVQAGVVLADLDAHLGERGCGLPVIGDHNDITAGGFASVGGISPASHKYGMFVDNVRELQYVTWEGELVTCSREERPDHFYRVLTGTGQYGIIVQLTVNIIKIDKVGTILRNERSLYRDVGQFLKASSRLVSNPGDAALQRSFWMDLGRRKVGQVSIYREVEQTLFAQLRNKLIYKGLHGVGAWAGRVPEKVDLALKLFGFLGMIFTPRYSSIKNVETFTDKVIDSTVGDPTRWFVVLTPSEKYRVLFRELYGLFSTYRKKYSCFTYIALYAKAIRSEYLAKGDRDRLFCELIVAPGIRPRKLTEDLLESLVSSIDDLCIEHGAYRYMHTKTVKDPDRRAKIDPNQIYATPPDEVEFDFSEIEMPAL
jgi:hypothetical protein